MRVRLIKWQSIENYIAENAQARSAFNNWKLLLDVADWEEPGDVKSTFNSADLLGNGSNRVIFNIGGNNYRMICKYQFGKTRVHLFIKWIGTHREYSKLCKQNLQYIVNQY